MRHSKIAAVMAAAAVVAGCSPEVEGTWSADGTVSLRKSGDGARKTSPPIAGGTLALTAAGDMAVAADPDHDLIAVVDFDHWVVRRRIELPLGSEPGRVLIDPDRRAHVLLRKSGELASFRLSQFSGVSRRPVCAEPRGLAYDALADAVVVACAGGELVWLPTFGEGELRRLYVEPDLRDVIVRDDVVTVSKLRSAEVLTLGPDGQVATRFIPPAVTQVELDNDEPITTFEPFVAWRMIPSGDRGFVLVHQRGQKEPVQLQPQEPATGGGGSSPYGGGSSERCSGILHSAVTVDDGFGGVRTDSFAGALPVDVARSASGELAVVMAGSSELVFLDADGLNGSGECNPVASNMSLSAQPVALAYRPSGELVVQTRNPSRLHLGRSEGPGVTQGPEVITLEPTGRLERGFELFHMSPNFGSIACASCHPEATEDGRVWNFDPIGPRRTQMLAGGLTGTAPFHWNGELDSMDHLLSEVLVRRMGGAKLEPDDAKAMLEWLDSVPAVKVPGRSTPEAVARGEALFKDPEVGCASCHSGPHFTNNTSVDVGTGGVFQVPSLRGLGTRTAFLHDGCAPTLAERFGPCGGGDLHGKTSQLTEVQRADLVAFLETL